MSKHEEISAILRDELQRSQYPEGSQFPAERELARRFSVSSVTVNKVIESLIRQGYLVRSGSRRGGTRVRGDLLFPRGFIGIIAQLRPSFHQRIIEGALRASYAAGYALVPIPADPESLESRVKQLEGGQIEGLLSLNSVKLDVAIPTVYVDKTNLDHHPNLFQVRCDSRAGGRAIAELLLREGHRDIVYFHDNSDLLSQVPRRQEFVETLREAGIEQLRERIFSASSQSAHGYSQALATIRRQFPGFTALACENDYNAFNMKCASVKLGLDLGGAIRLTGFGNIREIQQFNPFPTIEQHPEETGFRACRKLLDILAYPDNPPALLEELPVELIVTS